MSETTPVETQVSVRIDRLPWSRWHTLIVSSLGAAWILDGVEVMIVANISSVLTNLASRLGLSSSQVGYAAAIYSAGAALGLLFSYRSVRSQEALLHHALHLPTLHDLDGLLVGLL